MPNEQHRREVSAQLEQRRQALRGNPNVSERMRQLSESGSRHPLNPHRGRRPALLMALFAGSAVLAMLVCGILAITLIANGFWLHNQLVSPSTTAENFYSALHQQDFSTAYSYLSDRAKAHVSQADFTLKFQAYDQVSGRVLSYPIAHTTTNDTTATVVVNVTRSGGSDHALSQTLNFVQQDGAWRIDDANPPLWT
jgi:hypothetical protein